MKKLLSLAALITILTFTSCKKERNETVTVVRDCTGTYLRFKEKDYHVCNKEKVSAFEDGATVKATFKKIKECNRPDTVCFKLHPNEGWIDVEKIK